ncbi:MAG TPA: 30S ribosomal protein S6e [Candidatus Thermoplasmatota archaeon]|nr:30S ribosomal protein S6e [Candidatus Thermoplasmatota archaeon]
MAEFKCIVSHAGKSFNVGVKGHHANALVGKKIGDEVDGLFVKLPGYKLQITGGSDKEGFAMRPDLPGIARRRILAVKGHGFHPLRKGLRRRRSSRGNTITLDIVQVNLKVTKAGAKPVPDMLAETKEG